MPSLSEILAEKKRKEAESLQKAEEEVNRVEAASKAIKIEKSAKPIIKTTKKGSSVHKGHPMTVSEQGADDKEKEITLDTLRGLYWLATPGHIGDKKASRSQLKTRLEQILLSKDGMRMLLKSLEEFVFT